MGNLIPRSSDTPPVTPSPPVFGPTGAGYAEEETVDLREILSVLRRNLLLVLGIAGVIVAATAFLVLRQVPEYRATAVLRLQDARGAMTGGIAGAALEGMPVGRTVDPIVSAVQVLRSRSVASEVIDSTGLRLRSTATGFSAGELTAVRVAEPGISDTLQLRFDESAVVVRNGEGETRAAYGDTVFLSGVQFVVPERPRVDAAEVIVLTQQQAIERFHRGLGATIREQTDVIDVTYVDRNPRWAQQIANTAVRVFQSESAEAAQQQARRRRIFLEEQLGQTDAELSIAQMALTDFQRREGVSSSQEKMAAQQSGLMALDIRREELDADRSVLRSLLAALTNDEAYERSLGSLVSSPEVANNPVVSGLFTQLVRFQATRDSLTFGGSAPSNPEVQRLNQQIGSTRARLVEAVTSHTETLDARIAALDDLKARNLADLQALPASGAEEVRLIQRVEAIGKVADQLREEYQRARIAEAVEAGQVEIIDLAVVPSQPIGSGRGLKLVLGLMLGLMLGGGAAFLKEHLNTSIQRKEELEGVLQVPGLAVIPQFATASVTERKLRFPGVLGGNGNGNGNGVVHVGGNGNGNGNGSGSDVLHELVTVSDVRAAGSEAYRTLRTNLIFSQAIQSIRTLVVTSSAPAEGKTTTAANLAVTFGQQGIKVLIVDCDLRKARLHNVFGVPREPGLTQVVLGFNEVHEVVRPTAIDGLHVLAAGTLPPNPSELLGGARMREVVEELKESYDLVIFDTPPLLAASDASVLGTFADGVLLVVRAGHTDRGAAQQALGQLRTVGARVLGAVLNDPDSKIPSHGGYYYYNYYGSKG